MWKSFAYTLVATALLPLAIPLNAAAESYDKSHCFYTNDFDRWKAPDEKTIIIRVHPDRYFRLDLSQPCPTLMWPGAHLITRWRSSDWVCHAIDWDLRVSQAPTGSGATMGCIVSAMTEMTPQDVAAIPPKFKP